MYYSGDFQIQNIFSSLLSYLPIDVLENNNNQTVNILKKSITHFCLLDFNVNFEIKDN